MSQHLLKRLSSVCQSISITNANKSYLESYPIILQHFRSVTQFSESDLIIAAHIVYGWMPKVLTLDLQNITAATCAIQVVKEGQRLLHQEEIMTIASVVNKSIVGTSKLLHFVNPEQYPIWDRRVACFFLDKKRVHNYQVNNIEAYNEYINFCHQIAFTTDFQPIYDIINGKLQQLSSHSNLSITRIRATELIMFLANKGIS